jgi:hypothetical protein
MNKKMNPPDQPTPRTDEADYIIPPDALILALERKLTTERERVRVLREALEKYQHTVIAGGTNPARAALAATEGKT